MNIIVIYTYYIIYVNNKHKYYIIIHLDLGCFVAYSSKNTFISWKNVKRQEKIGYGSAP